MLLLVPWARFSVGALQSAYAQTFQNPLIKEYALNHIPRGSKRSLLQDFRAFLCIKTHK